MEPEERFERIEATLALTAEEHRRAMADLRKEREERDKELDKRHQLVMEDLDKRHRIFMDELARTSKEWDRRHEAAMARLDREEAERREDGRKVDEQIQIGMKLIAKNAADTRAFRVEVRAFIKALGNGHGRSNGRN